MATFPVPLSGADNTLMWVRERDIDEGAIKQLRNVAGLPWTHGLRVMPDVHQGYGAPVGSVIAMDAAVSPAAVGVDIGCGMTAVRTNLRPDQLPDDLSLIRRSIERSVPVGFASHRGEPPTIGRHQDLQERFDQIMLEFLELRAGDATVSAKRGQALDKAINQLGSLGGGNHFIELCTGDDERVWVVLHSGSRGTGNQLAQVYIERARGLPHNQELPDRDLAVLLAGTDLMADYLHDVWWAQAYALLNRDIMLQTICDELSHRLAGIEFEPPIRCHHNYVATESYGGVELIITRKGAIRAGHDEFGVIPGSMGTGSYIVRGLGNEASYQSASHGAGRRLSRTQARKRFTVADLIAQTKGVESRKDKGVIDEIPAAYKDIDEVIDAQRDLIGVIARLQTVLCVKG